MTSGPAAMGASGSEGSRVLGDLAHELADGGVGE